MELIPIKQNIDQNKEFVNDPVCQETIYMTIDFYKRAGYTPPWICYYVKKDGQLVGSCGFKGAPTNDTVEIAYGTFGKYQRQGIGTAICKLLVDLALETNPQVNITARTLPEENFSTRILKKNNFIFNGMVNDPEDGDVWEWLFKK
ncbi:MAG TPA: GNAT family protein [Chitinophagaceae bacterium]|nr:GNAT family protein [Chitinophagaceae bacterium]